MTHNIFDKINFKAEVLYYKLTILFFFFSVLSGCTGISDITHNLCDDNRNDPFFNTVETEICDAAFFRAGVMFSLHVEVNGRNEIEVTDLRVRDSGDAILPIVGAIELDGLTIADATTRLRALYAHYYVDPPLVRIQFSSNQTGGGSPWGYITVLGRVSKPGRVDLPATHDLTVSGAIQGAGGLSSSANQASVRITRIGTDNKKYQTVVNLNRIGADGAIGDDLSLRAGDLVFVPERIF